MTDEQFKAVLARRLSASDGLLKVFIADNDCRYPRLGVSVGKTSGGAVTRNRLKRLMREAFRLSQERIPAGFDYLVMISPQWPPNRAESVKNEAKKLRLEEVKRSLLTLVEKLMGKIA